VANLEAVAGRLNRVGYEALFKGLRQAKGAGNRNVELAHWLVHVLQDGRSDIALTADNFRLDCNKLLMDINAAISGLRKNETEMPSVSNTVMLTGEAGVQAASARPLIAKEAISSACISACRRRKSFGPATYVFARAPDFSPTLARANTLKPNLRPIRFKFGRTLEGNPECARQPVG
jgi:type VI secretion system protein VasG